MVNSWRVFNEIGEDVGTASLVGRADFNAEGAESTEKKDKSLLLGPVAAHRAFEEHVSGHLAVGLQREAIVGCSCNRNVFILHMLNLVASAAGHAPADFLPSADQDSRGLISPRFCGHNFIQYFGDRL
jgi:hypothetical protein